MAEKKEPMLELAVLGSSQFILGFQLAGIRNTIEAGNNTLSQIKEIMNDPKTGIIITEESIMNRLDEHDRSDIEASIKPVIIVLSQQAESESLRKMIKKSIGVDVWNK